jgi:hypothetical protein
MTAGANLYTLVYEGRSWALQGKGWGRAGQYNGCRRQVSVLRRQKINHASAEFAEGVGCCLLSCSIPTMGSRAMLLGLIDTDMASITITIINRCRSLIGKECARSIESEAWHQEQLDTKREWR